IDRIGPPRSGALVALPRGISKKFEAGGNLRSIVILVLGLMSAAVGVGAQTADGVLPTDAQGKPLNLDFETGTLKDWTASGDAFTGQRIKGEAIYAGRQD